MFKTEQEEFWAGSFGDEYIGRNQSPEFINRKVAFWADVLKSASGVKSCTEFGCNMGANLIALNRLNPAVELNAYEINSNAIDIAKSHQIANIEQKSIVEEISQKTVDLTFTVAVLIHINPELLSRVYTNLVEGSHRYVMVAEYYDPNPVEVNYRGHEGRLFKRDFAGEMIDAFDLKLVNYGFVYHRDNAAPQDDLTWFLMEKK